MRHALAVTPPSSGQAPVKPADYVLAAGCFGLVVAAVVLFFVKGNQYFDPRRPESFAPPVRETRTDDEERVRATIETAAHSAVFTSTRRPSEEVPPEREGPEPRPGVSLLRLCNATSGARVLCLDGAEIFSVDVPPNGSVALEVRSGEYDLMILGKVGEVPAGEAPVVVCPLYRRARLDGQYHVLISEGDLPPGFDCRRGHPADPTRRAP